MKSLQAQTTSSAKINSNPIDIEILSLLKTIDDNIKKSKNNEAQVLLNRVKKLAFEKKHYERLFQIYTTEARIYIATTSDSGIIGRALDSALMFKYNNSEYVPNINFYRTKALYFQMTAQLDSALHSLFICEKLAEKNDPYYKWWVYNEMAIVYRTIKNYEKAEKYYLKSLEIINTKNIRMDKGLVLFYIKDFYGATNNHEKYAWILNEYNLFKQEKPEKYLNDDMHDFLVLEDDEGNIQDRIAFLQKSKDYHIKTDNHEYKWNLNFAIGQLYYMNNELDKAIAILEENRDLYKEKGIFIINMFKNENFLYKFYKEKGEIETANSIADTLLSLSNELMKINNNKNIAEVEAKYQNEKRLIEIGKLNAENLLKEKQIAFLNIQEKLNAEQLEKIEGLKTKLIVENKLKDAIAKKEITLNMLLANENKLKASELQKATELKKAISNENIIKKKQVFQLKKSRQYLIALLSLASFLALGVLYLYFKQKNKNFIIQKQSNDLQTLMKEIHHRVKNNLQVVSGLLELQSNTLTDEKSSKAIREGKNRVQSMALIHQNLYNENNLKGIEVKPYLENLVRSICDSYNLDSKEIQINFEIDNLALDVDTMIPLGLIINELVTNSIKYAFESVSNKKINLLLKQESNELHLQLKDNGVGFSSDFNIASSKTFGLKLIRSFAQKLKAQINIYNNNGAVVSLHIKNFKLA